MMTQNKNKNNFILLANWGESTVTVGIIYNNKSYEARYSSNFLTPENLVWVGYKTMVDPNLETNIGFAGEYLNDEDILLYVNSYVEFLKNSLS